MQRFGSGPRGPQITAPKPRTSFADTCAGRLQACVIRLSQAKKKSKKAYQDNRHQANERRRIMAGKRIYFDEDIRKLAEEYQRVGSYRAAAKTMGMSDHTARVLLHSIGVQTMHKATWNDAIPPKQIITDEEMARLYAGRTY